MLVLLFSHCDFRYVPHRRRVPRRCPVLPDKARSSYGAHVLDHLAADRAGFAGGQVAVVAVLQVNADFPRRSFTY